MVPERVRPFWLLLALLTKKCETNETCPSCLILTAQGLLGLRILHLVLLLRLLVFYLLALFGQISPLYRLHPAFHLYKSPICLLILDRLLSLQRIIVHSPLYFVNYFVYYVDETVCYHLHLNHLLFMVHNLYIFLGVFLLLGILVLHYGNHPYTLALILKFLYWFLLTYF